MSRHGRSTRPKLFVGGLVVLGVAGAIAAIAVPAVARPEAPTVRYAVLPTTTTTEASGEAALVAGEDRRLVEVQTVSSLARWKGARFASPYRLSTNGGYTLVLTPRSAPYTVKDLLQLAPQTFLRMSDGSYLLGENLIVMPDATLTLAQPGGMTLRLVSSAKGFSSIVSMGGTVRFEGAADAPLKVTSWDVGSAQPDVSLSDGRAYIRAVGGRFMADWVNFNDLGFWSGRTGGVALTGTDRPFTGTLQSQTNSKGVGSINAGDNKATISPAGALPQGQANPLSTYELPSLAYVSSAITHSTFANDAYGLFVSDADSIQISDTSVHDSISDGIVLHRYVSNGLIERTTSIHNGGDGFQLDRATQAITITQATSSDNAGNGFAVSGRPLADGPSAAGASIDSYGNNAVNNSIAQDNGRYGIDVVGGFNIALQGNQVLNNDMGIVVRQGAHNVTIGSNQVGSSRRHGIALTDGVTGSVVTGNIVTKAATGIYIRASSATVKGNTLEAVSSHGISLVGQVSGTSVDFNVISGRGSSAIDGSRASGHNTRSGNRLVDWQDTRPWMTQAKRFVHPSTSLWAFILVLLLVSAVRSRESNRRIVHPYAHTQARDDIDLRDHSLSRAD